MSKFLPGSGSAEATGSSDGTQGGTRPAELEDSLNRFIYHPLARRLALALEPLGVSPNSVSVAGALLVMAAAWCYIALPWPLSAAIGLGLHVLWHVVDGADGDLARLTGKTSPTGELVDGVCDYSGHALLYVLLAAWLDDQLGLWAWALALAAGASHIAQTHHAETQRRTYLWWAYGVPWLKHAQAAGDEVFQNRNWFSLLFGWLARQYIRLSRTTTSDAGKIDSALTASAGDAGETARIRSLVRQGSAKSLALQKALGSNPRTIMLGISMALGSPIYFFILECLPMNLLLAYSVRHHNAANRDLAGKV